ACTRYWGAALATDTGRPEALARRLASAVAMLIYYTGLSTRLALGMLPLFALPDIRVHALSMLSAPLRQSSLYP
ncbi:MAG: hypothetical protein WCO40_11495, partial [Thermoleophilia bacterium]